MTGFTLRDPSGHVYRFPHFILGIGQNVVVHTGNGRNTQQNFYWRADNYVRNNDGDRAIFRELCTAMLVSNSTSSRPWRSAWLTAVEDS